MIRKIIKISELDTADHIHDKMGEFLDLPRYYGRNFDALFDVLTDLSERTYIAIDYEGKTLREVPACALTALRVLFDAAMVTPALRIVRPEELPEEAEAAETALVAAPGAEAVVEPEIAAPEAASGNTDPAAQAVIAPEEITESAPASTAAPELVIEPELAAPEPEIAPVSDDAAASTTSPD